MILPELSWQIVYARLAWAVVLAAVVLALLPIKGPHARRVMAAIGAAALLLMALPGPASAAWHLGLAFQSPSGLLTGLCLALLIRRWRQADAAALPMAPLLPPAAAAVLALIGTMLYLDAFGLLAGGYYYAGFGPNAAPLLAVLLAGAAAAAIASASGRYRDQGAALLGALALFSLARLPSGNLWDALLDPLLWGWSLAVLASNAVRRLRRGPAAAPPAPHSAAPELPALQAAGGEPYSPIKE